MTTFYYPKTADQYSPSDHITHKSVLFGFCENSTTHGIPQIIHSKGYIKTVLWIVGALCCTGGLAYQLYLITNFYLKYEVSPVIIKQTSRTQEFPSVSFCNTNPIKASAVHSSPELQALVDSWKKRSRKRRSTENKLPNKDTDSSENLKDTLNRVKRQTVTCPALFPPGNGSYTNSDCSSNSSLPGTICVAMCTDINDTLYGNSHVKCRNNGKWNMTERPCCESYCSSTMSDIPCGMSMKPLNHWSSLTNGKLAIWHSLCLRRNGKITQWRFYSETNQTFYPSIWRSLGDKSYELVGYNNVTSVVSYSEQVADIPSENQITAAAGDCLGVFISRGETLKLASERDFSLKRTPDIFASDVKLSYRYSPSYEDIIGQAQYTVNSSVFTNEKRKTLALSAAIDTCEDETTTNEVSTSVMQTTMTVSSASTMMKSSTADDLTTHTAIIAETSTTSAFQTTTTSTAFPDRVPLREDYVQETEVIETLADLPEDVKLKVGYALDDLILSCLYENKECKRSEFGHFFDAVYGNCYIFNSRFNSSDKDLLSRKPGYSSGLKMIFNIGQHEYLEKIAQSAGIVVVVHPKNRMPFPEDEGVFAAPGQITSIGINKVSISRLSHPYSNCSTETRNPFINVFEEHYNIEYSLPACLKTCYQKYVMGRCNCSDPQYPNKGMAFMDHNFTSCSTRDIIQDNCAYGVLLDYIDDSLECNCPTPCKETTYKYTISHALWPSDVHQDNFIDKYGASLGSRHNYSSVETFLGRNIVKIEVFFNEFNYKLISEKPKYPIYLFLADTCSILGLWLGLSLFSLSEFLELVVDLLVVSCCHIKKRTQSKGTIKGSETRARQLKYKERRQDSMLKPTSTVTRKRKLKRNMYDILSSSVCDKPLQQLDLAVSQNTYDCTGTKIIKKDLTTTDSTNNKQTSTQSVKRKKLSSQNVTSDKLSTQNVTSDESSTQNVTRDESSTLSVTSDESSTQNVTSDESSTQSVTSDESSTQNVTSDESSTQNVTRDESSSQNVTSDESSSQNVTSDESSAQNVTRNESRTQNVQSNKSSTQNIPNITSNNICANKANKDLDSSKHKGRSKFGLVNLPYLDIIPEDMDEYS